MQVTINGEPREFPSPISVSDLLQQLELADKRIAVEINEAIIPKGQHPQTLLQGGDQVEIIHAIGGG